MSSEDEKSMLDNIAEFRKMKFSPSKTFQIYTNDNDDDDDYGNFDAGGGFDLKDLTRYENTCMLKDVFGLSRVKEILLSIFIYPALFPHFFPRKIRWSQILFYGPPGTGKTMLANGIAAELNADLHRISSADLLSHWQGESEKQIRRLFQDIQCDDKVTILFFDEIDGLCRRRTTSEDDNVRRIKTELLTQLDDLAHNVENCQIYVIGATNCPWELDPAFMRRFHKKIFIPLPEKAARLDILKQNFENIETDLTDSEWDKIGLLTEGYSGSDLKNVVMNACCERFLQMKKSKYWEAKGDFWIPASSQTVILTRMNFEDIPQSKLGSRHLSFFDLEAGVSKTSKTVATNELEKYLEFSKGIRE